MFVDITFFGRTAEVANQYLKKGSKILLDGRLRLEQWTSEDGTKRSKHSVTVDNMQMLGSKDEAAPMAGGAPASTPSNKPNPAPAPTKNIPEIDINEDEIPF